MAVEFEAALEEPEAQIVVASLGNIVGMAWGSRTACPLGRSMGYVLDMVAAVVRKQGNY